MHIGDKFSNNIRKKVKKLLLRCAKNVLIFGSTYNMAVVWCARFVLLVLITISVKKPAFLNSDSVCYDLNESSPTVFEQNNFLFFNMAI